MAGHLGLRFMIGSIVIRLRRLKQNTQDIYRQAGFAPAALYVLRYVVVKIPLLLHHIVQRQKYGSLAKKISRQRARESPLSCPLIAIKVTGGIGDYIVATRFLRDLRNSCEDFVFDVYASACPNATWVFSSLDGCRGVYVDSLFDSVSEQYDVSLWVSQFVILYNSRLATGVLQKYPRLLHAITALKRIKSISMFTFRIIRN